MATNTRKKIDLPDGTFAFATADIDPATGVARSAALAPGVNRSGAITTGGTAQPLAPANTARQSLSGQNISAGDLWINEVGGTAAVDTAGSYRIVAGAAFNIRTNQAISIIGATTGQKFTATEI